MCEAPSDAQGVTASFREDASNAHERLNLHAAQRDLVVIGRARQKHGLGACGRSRRREILFGSRTDRLFERSDRPILLMH
jgi:nucleotide-binding universal stress UspA family protein